MPLLRARAAPLVAAATGSSGSVAEAPASLRGAPWVVLAADECSEVWSALSLGTCSIDRVGRGGDEEAVDHIRSESHARMVPCLRYAIPTFCGWG